MKRIVIVSDFHCGHCVGLTPPPWNKNPDEMRDTVWNWFAEKIKSLSPISALIVNGDAIEGKGERSGSTELIEPDITDQCQMAIDVIKFINADIVRMTYGTAYHVGATSDFEKTIARAVNAEIGSHEWYECNGLIFDVKHKVSSSVVPYGRITSLEREKTWNQIWSLNELQPRADIIIRSHVHAFNFSGDAKTLSIKTPALQGFGSKYGTRECSGTVDIGFISFDIDDNGEYTWQPHILEGEVLKAQISQL